MVPVSLTFKAFDQPQRKVFLNAGLKSFLMLLLISEDKTAVPAHRFAEQELITQKPLEYHHRLNGSRHYVRLYFSVFRIKACARRRSLERSYSDVCVRLH